MPTLSPACHLVPRWRARILPASADWPPNSFRPRRRPAESRPLRDEPPAFLCAMVDLSSHSAASPWRGSPPLQGPGWLAVQRRRSMRCRDDALRRLRDKIITCSARPRRHQRLRRRGVAFGALGPDFGDANDRKILTVPPLAAGILAAALLESDDLGAAPVLNELARDGCARNGGV